MATVYDAAGGLDGLLRLAEAWHTRVMADEVVSHAFSHGYRADHTERLAAYWAEALGGPPLYTGAYGDETAVVRVHSGNGPHEEMDRPRGRVLRPGAHRRRPRRPHARGAVRTTSRGRPPTRWASTPRRRSKVPDGLPLPRWSWDGRVA